MPFQVTPNVTVIRDAEGRIEQLSHLQQPYSSPEAVVLPPRGLTEAYLRDVVELYELSSGVLDALSEPVDHELRPEEGDRLRLFKERAAGATHLISFRQTHIGLPVWEAVFEIRMQEEPLRVTGSQTSVHRDVDVSPPPRNARFLPGRKAVETALAELVGRADAKLVRITDQRLWIYRYDPAQRFDPEAEAHRPPPPVVGVAETGGEAAVAGEGLPTATGVTLEGGIPVLPLLPVPRDIRAGNHYVVNEVLFTLAIGPWPELHWRALFEVRTGAVLYLRAFVTSAFGNVFPADPVTLTGNTGITPCSPAATLDPLTSVVTLPGLTAPPNPGDPQSLSGEFVALGELAAPAIAGPTAALPAGNFSFSAPTDNFAAVNTYYSSDRIFRFMDGDLGIDVPTYFVDSTFPLTVDHRDASLGTVNARGYGSAAGSAGGMGFNLAQAGCALGISADYRVVLHEFCHELLWENVGSPNFGFAHSAGDSLAAILLDPGSQAPDRFLTFPFISILNARRHDRDVTAGWAWGGINHDTQYLSEQILSTTLFRVYRSTGGDSGDPAVRRFAAKYLTAMIIKGIGLLTATTTNPVTYVDALMNADTGTTLFDGIAGGGIHKVIRWSFEQQGLYQAPGSPTPVTGPGAPPDVDVYIDDGRNGQYQYLGNFWNTTAIWNRLGTTAGTEADHETPVVGDPNYLFVRVKNRGTLAAQNVVVRTFHCVPATGLVWPDDWQSTTTGQLSAPGSLAPGADVIVGPFEWTPQVIGHECLLAEVSADGDLSNIDPAGMLPAATGPIPHWRLVPFDNNIAQRNVAPVPGGGGAGALVAAFVDRSFLARNPYDRPARIELVPRLPQFLQERGWQLRFLNPGGASFTLGPRADRQIVLDLLPGRDFGPHDAIGDQEIVVEALIDGMTVGGMSYRLDPRLTKPAPEVSKRKPPDRCLEIARHLLECLDLPADDVRKVHVRRVTVDIDLDDDC